MEILLIILALVMKLTNVILHGLGIYLLRRLPERNKAKPQVIYIMNLSVIELILNTVSLLRRILKMTSLDISKANKYMQYTYIFDYSFLKFSLHLTMIAITLDRMFLIILNVKYSKYFTKKIAKLIVRGIWVASGFMFIVYVLLYVFELKQDASKSCVNGKYLLVIFDVLFVIIAVVAYYLIFKKHTLQQSQRLLQQAKNLKIDNNGLAQDVQTRTTKQSFWHSFKNSRFYIALLLILTFIVFVIPPDVIFAFYACNKRNIVVKHVTTISYALSYFSDGIVYIFLNREVRSLFLKLVRKTFKCCFRDSAGQPIRRVDSIPLISKTSSM